MENYKSWIKEEKLDKLKSIERFQEQLKELDRIENLSFPFSSKEELFQELNKMGTNFYNIPIGHLIDSLLTDIVHIKVQETTYLIAGLRFSYDNFLFSNFSFDNNLRSNKFKREMLKLREEFDESTLEDQVYLATKEEVEKHFGENYTDTKSPEYLLKWARTFAEITIKGHRRVIFERREELESKKEEVANKFNEELMKNLREAKRIGFLDLLMEIHESDSANLRVTLLPSGYYMPALFKMIE